MNKVEKYAVFTLDSRHTPIDERRSGSNRGVSIPAKDIINMGEGKMELIAYIPESGQQSIYIKDWKNYKGETDMRSLKASKITFTDKSMILDPNRHGQMIEYMRTCNFNGSNEERDNKVESLFFEEKQEEVAQEDLENKLLTFRATEFIINSRLENLANAAELLDVPTTDRNDVDLTEIELKMDLIRRAESNPMQIIDIFNNPRLEMSIQLNRAFKTRKIYFEPSTQQILWEDTKNPVINKKVRKGMLPIDVLLNHCAESGADGKAIYSEILYEVNGKEAIEYSDDKEMVVDEFDSADIVTAAFDMGLLIKAGAYTYIGEKDPKNMVKSRGRKAVEEMIDNNEEFNGYNVKEYLVDKIKKAHALNAG